MPLFTPGAVQQRIEHDFGGSVREEETTFTVGITVVQLAVRDPERVLLVFVNLGAAEVLVSPRPNVSTTRGIRLAPTGGFLSMNVREDANLSALEWFAISSAAGNTVYRLLVRRETQTVEGGAQP